jgi:glycosyltransferase involved in cell wall biosynthesis
MKIGFFYKEGRFLKEIIPYLEKRNEVKRFSPKQGIPSGHEALKPILKELYELMVWADISFFEWCDELAVYGSRFNKVCKIVIRLHYSEVYSNLPDQVRWENVDCLIFVADHVRRILKEKIPRLEERVKTQVIHNGVDLKRFRYKERGPGYNIAYVGYLNHKKNPSLLLQCISSLLDIDSRYRLHIAGFHEQPRYKLYFENLMRDMGIEDNIKVYGWVDDVASWLEDKDYILSTSIGEGHPVGVMEAMAKGIKPLIHNWPGAKELFPTKYIFNTIDDFKRMVLNGDYDGMEYRSFIEENYSLKRQLKAIERLLS